MAWERLLTIFLTTLPFSFALNPTTSVDLAIVRLVVPGIFLLWLLEGLIHKKLIIDYRPRFFLFLFFLLLTSFSYFWAIDQGRAIKKLLFILPLFSLYFPIYAFSQQPGGFRVIARTLVIGSALAALVGIVQFCLQFMVGLNPALKLVSHGLAPLFQGQNFARLIVEYPSWLVNIGGHTVMRAFGTFPDPHLFSLYLNMTLPLAAWLYIKNRQKRFLWAGSTILLASLLSFSRAAYLSLAVTTLFSFSFSPIFQLFRKNPLPWLLATIAMLALLIIPNPLTKRFFDSFNVKEGSNSGRLEMWEKAVDLTADQPLTGVGIGNFSRAVEPASFERNPIYAHNLFLDFSAETGLLSGILLMFALLCPILYFFHSRSLRNQMIASCFVIFIVHSLFETPFYSVHVYPLVITLLAIKVK